MHSDLIVPISSLCYLLFVLSSEPLPPSTPGLPALIPSQTVSTGASDMTQSSPVSTEKIVFPLSDTVITTKNSVADKMLQKKMQQNLLEGFNYNKCLKETLKMECGRRKLKKGGSKGDLIKRLMKDDAEQLIKDSQKNGNSYVNYIHYRSILIQLTSRQCQYGRVRSTVSPNPHSIT